MLINENMNELEVFMKNQQKNVVQQSRVMKGYCFECINYKPNIDLTIGACEIQNKQVKPLSSCKLWENRKTL